MTALPAVGRGPLETEIWRTGDLDPATAEAARRYILRRATGWDDAQHIAEILGLRNRPTPEPAATPNPASRSTAMLNTELDHHTTRWQRRARCRNVDPELFFSPDGEQGRRRDAREAAAVGVCTGCPVRAACLQWALDNRQEHGVWGGLTEAQRKAERRRRGRTRKDTAA